MREKPALHFDVDQIGHFRCDRRNPSNIIDQQIADRPPLRFVPPALEARADITDALKSSGY
jgi:hypothetical protein